MITAEQVRAYQRERVERLLTRKFAGRVETVEQREDRLTDSRLARWQNLMDDDTAPAADILRDDD
jgi:hypothetical protein